MPGMKKPVLFNTIDILLNQRELPEELDGGAAASYYYDPLKPEA